MREKFWLRVARFAAKRAGDYQVRERMFKNVTFEMDDDIDALGAAVAASLK